MWSEILSLFGNSGRMIGCHPDSVWAEDVLMSDLKKKIRVDVWDALRAAGGTIGRIKHLLERLAQVHVQVQFPVGVCDLWTQLCRRSEQKVTQDLVDVRGAHASVRDGRIGYTRQRRGVRLLLQIVLMDGAATWALLHSDCAMASLFVVVMSKDRA